jgi:hypothetical protein
MLAGFETIRLRMAEQNKAIQDAMRRIMGDNAWQERLAHQGALLAKAVASIQLTMPPAILRLAEAAAQAASLEEAGLLPHLTTPWNLVSKEISTADRRQRVLDYYAENWGAVEADFAAHVLEYRIDDEAKSVFSEALACHREGLYRAAVRTLFPEMERVYRSAFEIEPHGHAVSLIDLRETGGALPVGVLLEFQPTLSLFHKLDQHIYERVKSPEQVARCAEDPVPNRHAALHGLVVYSTQEHSLNTLIMADFVFYLIHQMVLLDEEAQAATVPA